MSYVGGMILLLLAFTGCGGPSTGTLSVQVFDCDANCWRSGTIEVPDEYWHDWITKEACDDGGVTLAYDGECVQTRDYCGTTWADDPAVDDATSCCGGITAEDLEVGACGDTGAR